MQDIIRQYSEEILNLYSEGLNYTQIAKKLNEDFSLGIKNMDSFRRSISSHISKGLESEPFKEISEEIEKEESTFADKYQYEQSYYYDEVKDVYIVHIKNRPYRFTGTIIRDMKARYSNMDGSPETINEICRNFEIPRNVFVNLKTILGWSHDSEPVTDEELMSRDMDEMVHDLLQKRKFSYFQKYTRKEEKMLQEAASNWWAFQGLKVNPFVEKMKEYLSSYKVEKLKLPEGEQHAVVISPYDLHYGKYSWSGEVMEQYNRQIARELLLEKTRNLIPDIIKYNVEKIIIPVGSDFFHIDTLGGTTTKGTPQDCDGTYVQIMVEGNQLMVEFIDILRQVANVEIVLAAGNHDFKLSHALLQFLGAYYRNANDVNVLESHRFRQYFTYGKTLMGFTHGDGAKHSDLPLLMANESPAEWATCPNKVFFTGHLHHEVVKDYNGVRVFQMPSLSGSDRWHHNHGYEGSVRALHAYVINKETGVKATLMANVSK
jgi:predicted phosphodiesterase